MPKLSNTKHELFAQYRANGYSQADAYEKAGYTRNSGNASVLEQKEEVAARIQEIIDKKVNSGEEKREKRRRNAKDAQSLDDLGLNRMWIITELMNLYDVAYATDDVKTAMGLLQLLGKELGMFSGTPVTPETPQAEKAATQDAYSRIFGAVQQAALEPTQPPPAAPATTLPATPQIAPPAPPVLDFNAALKAFDTDDATDHSR